MEFNIKKCSAGNKAVIERDKEESIQKYSMIADCHLKHINKITGDTHKLLRNIRMAFKYLDEEMIKKLITSLIGPKLNMWQ